MKRLFFVSLCIFAWALPLCALGKKVEEKPQKTAPDINGAFIVEENSAGKLELRLTLDWNGIENPFDRRFALYRYAPATGQNSVYTFVSHLPFPQNKPNTTEVRDSSIVHGAEYHYQIFYTEDSSGYNVFERARSIPQNTIPANIIKAGGKEQTVIIPEARQGRQARPGIYVGLMSFSNDALDITKASVRGQESGTLLPLDTLRAKDALVSQFEGAYRLSESYGTSIYYALHKALVNISNSIEAGGVLPNKIDSIHIVVITDGYDNNSSDPKLERLRPLNPRLAISEAQRRGDDGGYPEFFKQRIFTPEGINNIPVTTWIFGIKNQDAPGDLPEDEFARLKAILNTQDINGSINEISNLQRELLIMLSKLDGREERTLVFAAMPALTSGEGITIKVGENVYIKAKVQIDGNRTYLSNIVSEPEKLLARPYTEIEYEEREGAKGYEFIVNGDYYSERTGVSVSGLVSVDSGADSLGGESFVNFNPYNYSTGRKTALVYFVIDNSRSLGGARVSLIRSLVSGAIEDLYTLNVQNERIAASFPMETPSASASQNSTPVDAGHGGLETANSGGHLQNGEASASNLNEGIRITNPAIPSRNTKWSVEFTAFVQKFTDENTPWRTKTSNVSPLNAGAADLGWYIQTGAYRDSAGAAEAKRILESAGFTGVHIYEGTDDAGKLYKVHIGAFDDAHINTALAEIRVIWRSLRKH
ncbi:MAG: SPOR domain-containing protein [Spirochaetaceae bacterium]|nr:SPOR domain-containing protein [Spirochaetaceae bacterium]